MASRLLFKWSDGSEYRSYENQSYDPIHGTFLNRPTREWQGYEGTPQRFGAAEKWDVMQTPMTPDFSPYLRSVWDASVRGANANRTRTFRKDTMRNARRIAAENRDARRIAAADSVTEKTPLECLLEDRASGCLPRADEIVTETLRVREGNRNVFHTLTLEAPGYLVQLERLTRDYESARRVTESVMRHAHGSSGKVSHTPRTRLSKAVYLTRKDLEQATRDADDRGVEVMAENARGITCIRYFRRTA